MRGKRIAITCLAVAVVLSWAHVLYALLMTEDKGMWPDSWPKELEAYRKQAKTIDVAHGIQERVFEIPFESREEFENAWPVVLKLKDTGAPLILEKSPSTYRPSESTMTAGVRILWSSDSLLELPDGKRLHAGPPWPDSVRSASGELPEYVYLATERGEWAPFTAETKPTMVYRARIDIVLVTDGQVVDLNRIGLPTGTPIVDRRFSK